MSVTQDPKKYIRDCRIVGEKVDMNKLRDICLVRTCKVCGKKGGFLMYSNWNVCSLKCRYAL